MFVEVQLRTNTKKKISDAANPQSDTAEMEQIQEHPLQ